MDLLVINQIALAGVAAEIVTKNLLSPEAAIAAQKHDFGFAQ